MEKSQRVKSGRHEVALHRLRAGVGTPLLLIHELEGSSIDFVVDDSPPLRDGGLQPR